MSGKFVPAGSVVCYHTATDIYFCVISCAFVCGEVGKVLKRVTEAVCLLCSAVYIGLEGIVGLVEYIDNLVVCRCGE